MIPVAYFSYAPDAALLALSVQRCVDLGLGPVFVFEDSTAPFTDEFRGSVPATFRTTTFCRKGNLRGQECVRGMAQCYLDVMEETGAPRILKLDSDTAPVRVDWFQSAANSGADLAGACSLAHSFFGCAYLISEAAAMAAAGYISTTSRPCAEDFAMHAAATAAELLVLTKGIESCGGLVKGWHYSENVMTIDEMVARFDVVTFGNWRQNPGITNQEKREVAALEMAKLREIVHKTL